MSNFPEEISRQQRLKRWIVAPFGQAKEDKGLSWDSRRFSRLSSFKSTRERMHG